MFDMDIIQIVFWCVLGSVPFILGGLNWREYCHTRYISTPIKKTKVLLSELHIPHPNDAPIKMAAKLAAFAELAYAKKREAFEGLLPEGSTLSMVGNANAGLLIFEYEDVRIIAISGTDDKADARMDFDVLSIDYAAHCRTNGHRNAEVLTGVRVHTGMAAYASLCVVALEREGVDFYDGKTNYLTGHSLGGAACVLVKLFMGLRQVEVFTFGAPKTMRRNKSVWSPAKFTRVERLFDPVPWSPDILFYKHWPSHLLMIRYRGSVRGNATILSSVVRVARYAIAICMRRPVAVGTDEHRIDWYRYALEPFV